MLEESIINKLESLRLRSIEISDAIAKEGATDDMALYTQLNKEYAEIIPIVDLFKSLSNAELDLSGAQELLDSGDSELVELAKNEINTNQEKITELEKNIKFMLLPKDKADDGAAYLEIRAGAGGDEAAIFAADLFRMYSRLSERQGWKFEIVNTKHSEPSGIKEAVVKINGQGVFKFLKFESGVHRVQRVPETESQGRIHTSAVTVAVLPRLEDINITINQEDIRTDIFHSGGAGGQNVNKVATAVRLTHNPSGIVVTCQRERSQSQNRLIAMDLLKVRLWDLEYQKQQSEHSKNRKDQVGSGDRSEKIRTYNFPQGRITDHRINESVYNLDEFLNGSIDILIDKLIRNEQIMKLSENEDN